MKKYQQILVPINGTKTTLTAIESAAQIAKQNRAQIHLVNVINVPAFQGIVKVTDPVINKITEHSKKLLDHYQSELKQRGLITDYSIEYGSPEKSIINVAKRWHVDLIIMNTSVKPSFTGLISSYISQTSTCDVLIVRN